MGNDNLCTDIEAGYSTSNRACSTVTLAAAAAATGSTLIISGQLSCHGDKFLAACSDHVSGHQCNRRVCIETNLFNEGTEYIMYVKRC